MQPLIRSRRIVVPLAVLALAGTGAAAYGAASDDGVRYRTVAATRGDVSEELTLSGTISPSGTSELAFGSDGTVARVRVEQGEDVEQGQVIAVLDRASLQAAVDRARSDLAEAKVQLASDEDAQTTAVDTATSTPSTSTPTTGKGDTPAGGQGSAASNSDVLARLAAQQDDVLAAQSAATTALATAADRLADQQQACAEPTAPEPTDAATTDATTASTGGVLSEACTSALAAVQTAQADAADAQATLQTALETLGSTLTAALGSVSAATTPASPTTATPGTTPSTTPDTPTGAGRTVTAATLAQDQATIDKAAASLASARADLRGAVVRAPAAGTVVSLAAAVDDEVSAGDTVATLVAPGLTTVTVEVSATQAEELETGTAVEVTPAGGSDALAGTIGRIEHTATSSDSSSNADPTYAVQVLLDDRGLVLADGLPATVAIEVGAAQDVVVVPASAVSDGTVTVVDDTGTARRTPVTTGVVGATEVEITDGLDAGDRVVLADLDADLPTGDSGQQGGGFGGFGDDAVRMGPPGGGISIRP